MTCGALEAGAEVVLAVDSDPVPLKILGANAPHTTTVVATLGEGFDEACGLHLGQGGQGRLVEVGAHRSTACDEKS